MEIKPEERASWNGNEGLKHTSCETLPAFKTMVLHCHGDATELIPIVTHIVAILMMPLGLIYI